MWLGRAEAWAALRGHLPVVRLLLDAAGFQRSLPKKSAADVFWSSLRMST